MWHKRLGAGLRRGSGPITIVWLFVPDVVVEVALRSFEWLLWT